MATEAAVTVLSANRSRFPSVPRFPRVPGDATSPAPSVSHQICALLVVLWVWVRIKVAAARLPSMRGGSPLCPQPALYPAHVQVQVGGRSRPMPTRLSCMPPSPRPWHSPSPSPVPSRGQGRSPLPAADTVPLRHAKAGAVVVEPGVVGYGRSLRLLLLPLCCWGTHRELRA